jgi:hypothetical protein
VCTFIGHVFSLCVLYFLFFFNGVFYFLFFLCVCGNRDINASNTLLAEGGLVKIADFGVSALLKNEDQKRSTFIGSPNWMA